MFLGVGLLYLTFTPSERWAEQRTSFRNIPILTVFWLLSLLFTLAAPFIPNTSFLTSIPFYVVPVLGTSLLGIGLAYWFLWAKILPLMGFHILHEVVQLPDGSERVKYTVRLPPPSFFSTPPGVLRRDGAEDTPGVG